MRKSMLIALVALSAGFAVPPSALAETAPTEGPELRRGPTSTERAESQLESAQQAYKYGSSLAMRVSKMLDGARRDKDVMRADALNRKLTEINAIIRNLESRIRALQGAHAGNDQDQARHEFTVITVLGQKLNQIDQELSQLLTQDKYEPGASQVVTTLEPDHQVTVAPLPPPPGGGGGGGGLVFPQPGQSASPN